MTWEQFKKFVEQHGVTDNDEIHYIDFSYDALDVNRNDDNELEIS